MLKDYFRSPQTLKRLQSGPVGPCIEGFAEKLEAISDNSPDVSMWPLPAT